MIRNSTYLKFEVLFLSVCIQDIFHCCLISVSPTLQCFEPLQSAATVSLLGGVSGANSLQLHILLS